MCWLFRQKKAKNKKLLAVPTCPSSQKKAGLRRPPAASGSLQYEVRGLRKVQLPSLCRHMHSAEGYDFSGWPFGLPNCQIGLTPQCHSGGR